MLRQNIFHVASNRQQPLRHGISGPEIAIDGEFTGNGLCLASASDAVGLAREYVDNISWPMRAGEPTCTHTQLDIQPWWEVDLGRERVLESVTVWNRQVGSSTSQVHGRRLVTHLPAQDSPPFRSSAKDQFTKRLFPMWIMCSVR